MLRGGNSGKSFLTEVLNSPFTMNIFCTSSFVKMWGREHTRPGDKGHHQNISVLKDQLTIESIVLGSDQCRPLWSMGWLNSNVECISVKMREAFPHTSWGCKESDTIQHPRCSCCCDFPRPELAFQPVPDSLWQVTSQFYFPLHKWG